MVRLVALLEPAQDADCVFHRRRLDNHRLETPFQRGILLDAPAVLVERGGADAAQFPACKGWFEHVAGVHGSFGGACAHERVQLVDEQDDLPVRAGDLLQHGLETVLELAAILGAGHHRTEIQRNDTLVLEALRDVTRCDALRQPLDDGCLANARFADEHRIVLGPAAEHLDHPADLFVTADDWVELAPACLVRQVTPVFLERLILVLGIRIRHALRTPHRFQGRVDPVSGGTGLTQKGRCFALRLGDDAKQQMLGGDVLVLETVHLFEGRHQHGSECRTYLSLSASDLLGPVLQRRADARSQGLR